MSKQSIYRTVGVYPAQQFFHVESDGSVRLVASLTEDAQRNVVYQVRYYVLIISSLTIESFSFCWFLCIASLCMPMSTFIIADHTSL